MREKKKHGQDILLLLGFAAVGALLALFLLLSAHDGKTVQVRVSGAVTAEYPLSKDGIYELQGVGGANTLTISGGKAAITAADCPDALCIGMGEISRAGQSIICLPHELVVEIVDDGQSGSGVDAEAG